MKKLIKNKRGINDVSILAGILILFIGLGILLPFIRSEFSATGGTSANTDTLVSKVSSEVESTSTISAFKVLLSVLSMFFWTFGSVPLIIDALLLLPLRIILALIIARNIWIGGGA